MIVLIHKSDFDTAILKDILSGEGFEVIEVRYFAEAMHKIKGKDVLAGFAIAGENDTTGVDFLRSLLEYKLAAQRVIFTDTKQVKLCKLAVNRAHVDYMLEYPIEKLLVKKYIRKIERRYERFVKPFENFNMLSEVTEDLINQNEKYRTEAYSDSLTKLLNRRSFNKIGNRFWDRWEKMKVNFCMSLLDLDHFKYVNDTYGHTAGDLVLIKIADIFQAQQRAGIDFSFRYGGEEFAIMSSGTSLLEMELHIQRLHQAIGEEVIKTDKKEKIKVTISAGICASEQCTSLAEMILIADEALYKAKENGRNRVEVYKK